MADVAANTNRTTPIRARIIDLGCGKNKYPGSFGVDQVQLDSVDFVWNLLEFPYPFEPNSADLIVSQHTLEHFDPDTALRFIAETHRILKPGGTLLLACPHAFCPGAMEHPLHKSFWTFRSFDWLSRKHPGSYYVATTYNFDIVLQKASINLWAQWENPPRWKMLVNAALSRAFNLIPPRSKTLPDVVAKFLPFYRLDILVTLRKADNDAFRQ